MNKKFILISLFATLFCNSAISMQHDNIDNIEKDIARLGNLTETQKESLRSRIKTFNRVIANRNIHEVRNLVIQLEAHKGFNASAEATEYIEEKTEEAKKVLKELEGEIKAFNNYAK